MRSYAQEWETLDRPIARGTTREIMTPHVLQDIYGIDMAITKHPQTGTPVAMPG